MTPPDSEARRALNRLRRALEKSRRELTSLAGAGEQLADFPRERYREAEEALDRVLDFLAEEERRLQAALLSRGGIDPGRLGSGKSRGGGIGRGRAGWEPDDP